MNDSDSTLPNLPGLEDAQSLSPNPPPPERTASEVADPKPERWLPVRNYEKDYEISSYGRLRRISVAVWSTRKRVDAPGYTTYGHKAQHGYMTVSLKGVTTYVHRLVAEAFIPNPDNLPQVNHKDGNRCNNLLENLEWVTSRGNLLHRGRVLGKEIGSNHHAAKLTETDICEIWRMLASGRFRRREICARFGIRTVKHIVAGDCWSHVPRGTLHPICNMRPLTEEKVLAMRAKYQNGGISISALGRKYGCSYSQAHRTIKGHAWSHLPMPLAEHSHLAGDGE